MDIFEGKNKRYSKRLTKFGRNIVLQIKPRAAMFVLRFANHKSRALSHEPSSDCVIAHAKGGVRAQASYGNITVLSHLKLLGKTKGNLEVDRNFQKELAETFCSI